MVGIKDVALRANVSIATVSRVMNGKGPLSQKTIDAVHRAMEELDYRPNDLARALSRKKQSHIIAMYSLPFDHPFYSALLEAIEEESSARGFHLLILSSSGGEEKYNACLHLAQSRMIDGVIIGGHPIAGEKGHSEDYRIPMITVEAELEGIPCVVSDNYEGGRLATQRLLDAGCRNLIHIAGNRKHEADSRAVAFEDLCGQAGAAHRTYTTEVETIHTMDYKEIIERVLDENPHADGIFASSDLIAVEVLMCCANRGMRVPEQLRVVGFDNSPIGKYTAPRLTTVAQDIKGLGKKAVEQLILQIEGKTVEARTVLPVNLVERDSV